MQVIVNLAPGEKVQALVQNEGEVLPFQQGTSVSVHLPREALRVLPQGEVSEEGFTAAATGAAIEPLRSRSGRSPRPPSARSPAAG